VQKSTIGLALAGLLLASLLPGCSMMAERPTRIRVTAMMDGWKKAGSASDGNMQEAISMWFNGSRYIPDDVMLTRARKSFDDWRRQKDLYVEIQSWEISSIEQRPDVPGMVVALTIDGKPYEMQVERGEPIAWVR
jgi:hypothetical protein